MRALRFVPNASLTFRGSYYLCDAASEGDEEYVGDDGGVYDTEKSKWFIWSIGAPGS